MYGCVAAPLSSTDAAELSATQAASVKTALGLPRRAHHSALLAAAGICPAHEMVRAACFRAAGSAMRSQHRLYQALLSGLAKLALHRPELGGSLLAQLSDMCSGNFAAVLDVIAGRPHDDRVSAASRTLDGLVDSLRSLLRDSCQASRRLIRLLTCPDASVTRVPYPFMLSFAKHGAQYT